MIRCPNKLDEDYQCAEQEGHEGPCLYRQRTPTENFNDLKDYEKVQWASESSGADWYINPRFLRYVADELDAGRSVHVPGAFELMIAEPWPVTFSPLTQDMIDDYRSDYRSDYLEEEDDEGA